MMADYNGWSNRETWNANLHLFCDDQEVTERAQWVMGLPIGLTDKAGAMKRLAQRLWGDKTPDDCQLCEVDWLEIVQNHEAEMRIEEEYLSTLRGD